jgi:hypothetical protein
MSFSRLRCCYLLFFSVALRSAIHGRQPTCREIPPHTPYLWEQRHEPCISGHCLESPKTRLRYCAGRWSHALFDVVYRSQRVSVSLCHGENLDDPRSWFPAFLLLHIVLCIGPLCRLDPKFLPLLYNRRHLGVVTFLLGAIHSVVAIRQFHSPVIRTRSSVC